ncbi:MAG: diguanylate cyclase domain-containing protein [Alkaliphilus sp.]
MNKTNSINGTKKSYIEFFNNIVLKYMQYSFAEIDYKSIVHDLMLLSNVKYVYINEYCREKGILQTKAIGGFSKQQEKMVSALEFDLIGKEWSTSSDEQPIIGTRKLKKHSSLSSIISDKIPGKTIKMLENFFGAGDVYTIGFYQNDELFGNLVLYLEVGEELKEQDLVELFARLLGIVLHRRRTEEKLRTKKIELQKSNQELTLANEELTAMNEEASDSMQQLLATEIELREKYNELRIKEKELIESDKRWTFALEAADAGIWDWNIKANTAYSSMKLLNMFGYGREDELFFSVRKNRVHPHDIGKLDENIKKHLSGETRLFENIQRVKCRNGSYKWIFNRGKVISRDEAGNPIRMIGLYVDYEEQKKIQEQLTKQKKTMESLFEFSPDAVAHLTKSYHVVDINSKFAEMFGYSKDECRNRYIDDLICSPEQKQLGIQVNKMSAQNLSVNVETQRVNKSGVVLPVLVRGGPTIVDGEIIGHHAIYTDISDQKRTENHIRSLSYQDALTGLSNRAYFEEQLLKLNTIEMHPISIIIADVNSLKLVNDVFGHDEGDKLIKKFAMILKEQCRKDDIIARWGGDEFAIILPQTSEKVARKIGNRIRKACRNVKELSVDASVAIGCAEKKDVQEKFSDVVKMAEKNMYKDKLLESKKVRKRIIASLQNSILERNIESKAHIERMEQLSKRLGKRLNLRRIELSKLSLLAKFHDIGKIAISDVILLKPTKLTNNEWEEVKKHSAAGYRIVQSTTDSSHIAELVLSHHEHWDGRGYPQGLKGTKIPKLARIIAVIDAYDVMTNGTVYKKAISQEEALEEIRRCTGSQFDTEIASIFVEMMME